MLDVAGVSRRHARIWLRGGRFFAEDLQSQEGTRVNGVPLQEPCELSSGDTVAVGPVVLAFAGLPASAQEGPEELATAPAASPGVVETPLELRAAVSARQPSAEEHPRPGARPSGARPGLGQESRAGRPSGPKPALGQESRTGRPSGSKPALGAEPRTGRPPGPRPTVELEARPARPPEPRPTVDMEARVARPSGPKPAAPSEASPPPPPPPAAPADPQTTAPIEVKFFAPARQGPSVTSPDHKPVLESSALLRAVIRTRLRREPEASGGALLDRLLPPRLRWRLAFGVALAMALGAAGLWLFGRPMRPARRLEPVALGSRPVEDSFGLGDGVTWERPDFKAFAFEFNPPSRGLALVRYQASQISSDEVALSVNGVDLGMVPPDSHNVAERELELVLPPGVLKRGERNELIFDNLKNPPGREKWRIWNLSLEIVPLPDQPPAELLASAARYAEEGARLYRERQEGSQNLFLAWKAYRYAWLSLEGLDEKPALYREVRQRTQAIARELDERCGGLLLQAQGAIELKNRPEAKEALEEVSRYFPTGEHRCHNRALEMLVQYGL